MAARLFPAGGGPSIALSKSVMWIGRAAECDIHLNRPIVSKCHCVLYWDGTTWIVEDRWSLNGTAVGNYRITKQELHTGDTITLSKVVRFVIEFDLAVERERFADVPLDHDMGTLHGDDRSYSEHGPATKRLEPHDRDIWSKFEK
jgi:pSer/pThr/pTyr-binding forkhead associated (FHA) protein